MSIINKIFGDANERFLKKLQPIIEKINILEKEFEKFSNEKLKEKTEEFKTRLRKGETLDDLLLEAFALVREAAKRTLKQRHFDVQLIGGIVLHQGKIAEMKTGEGKTLAATLPLYLNGLEGKGCHLVTVNDYLARRDTVWMGQIYYALGLSVGCLNHEQSFLYDPEYKKLDQGKDKMRDELGGFYIVEDFLRPCSRKEAYLADITYGTNNEFGFDYLRDNMVYPHTITRESSIDKSQGDNRSFGVGVYDDIPIVQRGFNFAIIDEVDSILIDEARTPLIISAPAEEATEKYYHFAKLVNLLKENEDYNIDEKMRTATFTEKGQNKIVESLGFDPWLENDIAATHQLEAALKAKTLFQKDRDYVVKDGKVVIVDEFTGRLMPGRRWSGGLHQAIEAKENIEVREESHTLATITFQNYFRLYKKLAGMTGTAATSAEEFDKVYGLDVIVVPTNRPMIRKNLADKVYKTERGKFTAIVEEIKKLYEIGQPVLAGTRSVERNEYLGKLLEREGIPLQILNAKNHQREGEVIAQAGKLKAVTIATNMAGRGVDIILGGNPSDKEEQKKVIELGGLHIIGTERHEARRIDNQLRGRAGRQGDPGSSQFFVSLEDELMRVFGGDRIKGLMEMLKIPEQEPIEAKLVSGAIESAQAKIEGFNFDARKHILEYDDVMNKQREVIYKKRKEILQASPQELREKIIKMAENQRFSKKDYEKKEKEQGQENMRKLEKFIGLRTLDLLWIDYLSNMDYLRDSVRLRAYGGQDPLVEYKSEGRKMFQQLLETIDSNIVHTIFKVSLQPVPQPVRFESRGESGGQPPAQVAAGGRVKQKVGRNDPCPCGSGKKYKKCHGKNI